MNWPKHFQKEFARIQYVKMSNITPFYIPIVNNNNNILLFSPHENWWKKFYVTEQLQLKLIHHQSAFLMASADRHLSSASSIFLSSLSNKTASYKKNRHLFKIIVHVLPPGASRYFQQLRNQSTEQSSSLLPKILYVLRWGKNPNNFKRVKLIVSFNVLHTRGW